MSGLSEAQHPNVVQVKSEVQVARCRLPQRKQNKKQRTEAPPVAPVQPGEGEMAEQMAEQAARAGISAAELAADLALLLEHDRTTATATAEAQAALAEAMGAVAEAAKAAGGEELYFVARAAGQVADQVRKLTKLGEAGAEPQLLILDIPDEGGFYVHDGKVGPDSVAAFVAKYKAGGLERKQLKP